MKSKTQKVVRNALLSVYHLSVTLVLVQFKSSSTARKNFVANFELQNGSFMPYTIHSQDIPQCIMNCFVLGLCK
jgi:hypothetical protein